MGMTIGAGYVAGGIGLSLLTRGVLSVIGRWEQSHFGAKDLANIGLVFDPDHGKTEIKIEQLIAEFAISLIIVSRSDADDGRQRWLIQFQLTARHAREFLFELAKMPEVYAIERSPAEDK
jgi:hypothetical protein